MLPGAPRCTADVQRVPHLGLHVGLDGRSGQNVGGRRGQPDRRQIVDLVQIVEFGGQQHLRAVIERAVVDLQACFQLVDLIEVIEVAETVERQDFGDFVAVVFHQRPRD